VALAPLLKGAWLVSSQRTCTCTCTC
jgi:hypothetical protein